MDQCATAFKPPWWARLHPNRWEGYLFHALSDRTVGCESVPLSWTSQRFHDPKPWSGEYVMSFLDDAWLLGLGPGNETQWYCQLTRPMWHRMMRWYLWQFVAHEWCGLRRWLWYRLLHRRLNGARQRRAPYCGGKKQVP